MKNTTRKDIIEHMKLLDFRECTGNQYMQYADNGYEVIEVWLFRTKPSNISFGLYFRRIK